MVSASTRQADRASAESDVIRRGTPYCRRKFLRKKSNSDWVVKGMVQTVLQLIQNSFLLP